jgi:hypothetical protein
MKLADIPPGSDLAYRCAAKLIAEQIDFELETCRRLFGTEPGKVLECSPPRRIGRSFSTMMINNSRSSIRQSHVRN